MAIQVTQITGDTVELVFNPDEEDLHVGENLSVIGRHDDRGLIVQVIELKAIFPASPLSGREQSPSVAPVFPAPAVAKPRARSPRRRKTPQPGRDIRGLYFAIAKIRKMTDPAWQPWDGWLPTSTVIVTKTADHEMLRQCIPALGNPLWLGKTVAGEPFHIERATLGAVNLIVGAEGSETSHLAQVLVNELIDHGLPCIVFDTKGVYARLSQERVSSSTSEEGSHAIVSLVAGDSLKLAMSQVGVDAFSTMLRRFGLPKAVAMYFTSHVARRFARLRSQHDVDQRPPFLSIDDLMHIARDLEAEGQAVAGGAILSCLDAIKQAQVFATQPSEAIAFWDGYAQIRHGGALVIDLSKLPTCARTSVVSSLVGNLREVSTGERGMETAPLPCMFFDEAQALVARHFITDVLLPMSHLGLTSFFVTTMVTNLGDHLQHEADNLFLCQLTPDDVRHLAKRSRVDAATLQSVGRRLRTHHSLLVGRATGGYPIIFAMEPLDSTEVTGERPAFSHLPTAPRLAPGPQARPRFAARVPTPVGSDLSLPLFPDETPPLTATHEPRDAEPIATMSQLSPPTFEQMTAMWDHVVKRVARRRRILEPILAAARPLRVTEGGLVLSFPPQHRFQQELVESEEYRSLLEEEIKKVFGVSLEVTTEVYPT
jgi:Helicase HerA, central domain